MLSRICEEFGCTPLEAIMQPLGPALRIIEYRQYARTKQACEQAKNDAQTPTGPMARLVFEFEAEMAGKKIRFS